LGGAPEVEIKNLGQLLGSCQRHDLPAILKSTVLNDPVEQIRSQSGDDMLEAWRVQNAIEQITPAWCPAWCMDPRWQVAGPICLIGALLV
jgi:hypothetical protein